MRPATDSSTARASAPGTRPAWVALLLIASVTAAAFWPVLSADWVQWDDDRNFTEHHAWRGLSGAHLAWMFTTFHMGHYQPLSWLTLALDWSVWGLDARGFHATNLALHAGTALALWFLARRLLARALGAAPGDPGVWLGATFAALVFAVHPLRVESVAWITERRDVLGGLFFVLATHAWVRHAEADEARAGRWYAIALACALLSLLSKASAMVLPALFLLIDVYPLRRWPRAGRRMLLDKLPFVALTLVFAALALRAQAGAEDALLGLDRHGPLERALQAAYALAFYLGKTLWPSDLVPVRELPDAWLAARYLLPALATLGITAALVLLRRRYPALLAAWVAYAVILSPVSGVAQAGPQLVADRYSYFACLPFALLAGSGLVALARRHAAAARVAGLAIVLVLAVATRAQARVWRDTESLWSHALAVDPDAAHPLRNLASWKLVRSAGATDPAVRRRLLQEARALSEHGLRVAPGPAFEVSLGLVAGQMADLDTARRAEHKREALERIERAVRLGEAAGRVETGWRFQLGAALLEAGRVPEAIRELTSVAEVWPRSPQVHRVLSLAHASEQRWSEAARHAGIALELQPDEPLLWLRAGTFHARLGERHAARAALERALELCGSAPARGEIATQARAELEALSAPR